MEQAYILPIGWNVGGVGTGAGKYGYNGTPATCLPNGGACGAVCTPTTNCNKNTAFYFRRNINFTAAELATTFTSIQLNLQRDDGVVIYVNGIERARNNMPNGVINFGTQASSDIALGAAENYSVNLSTAFFAAGANTIAVEVHTAAVKSADMSFDMEVLGINNNGTFNSSTSDLNLPTCSSILFAGLYWGAGEGSNVKNTAWITGETTCKLHHHYFCSN
jgi:hypothetical protein